MTHDPYGSHVPFLTWVGQHITPIRTVLELGAGRYSTPLWLDRSIFPLVEKVVSVEHDQAWYPRIDDHRLQAVTTNVVMFTEALHDLSPYDLVFIDNGSGPDGEGDRMRTIRAILSIPEVPMVVIHDWDNVNYREAAIGHYDWVVTDEARPQTALLIRSRQW